MKEYEGILQKESYLKFISQEVIIIYNYSLYRYYNII